MFIRQYPRVLLQHTCGRTFPGEQAGKFSKLFPQGTEFTPAAVETGLKDLLLMDEVLEGVFESTIPNWEFNPFYLELFAVRGEARQARLNANEVSVQENGAIHEAAAAKRAAAKRVYEQALVDIEAGTQAELADKRERDDNVHAELQKQFAHKLADLANRADAAFAPETATVTTA